MWHNDKTEILTDEKRQGSNSMRAAERMKRGVMKKKRCQKDSCQGSLIKALS